MRNGLFNPKSFSVFNFTCRVGKLHLHPISEMHQLRPSLTYLDVLSRKNKRSRGGGESDSESDDGPPPDPDEATAAPPKKEKKSTGEVKEVHVTARKADDSGALGQGGMSAVRREMLHIIRAEEEDKWENFAFCDVTVCLSLSCCTTSITPSSLKIDRTVIYRYRVVALAKR
jgi:DNA-directed RNA polymerase-3 subunit RPC5